MAQIELSNNTLQGHAVPASYASAALGFTITANALPWAVASFRNTGTVGFWFIMFARTSGPTTTFYSKKLGPGEPWALDNPPIGQVWFLQDGTANGNLDWFGAYGT